MFGGEDPATTSFLNESYQNVKKSLKHIIAITPLQFVVMLGLAITGLASLIILYNWATGISADMRSCTTTGKLNRKLWVQFSFLLILAIIAIVVGIVLVYKLRNREGKHTILVLSLILFGLFAIAYAFSIRATKAKNGIRLTVSLILFGAFLMIGIFIASKTDVNKLVHAATEQVSYAGPY